MAAGVYAFPVPEGVAEKARAALERYRPSAPAYAARTEPIDWERLQVLARDHNAAEFVRALRASFPHAHLCFLKPTVGDTAERRHCLITHATACGSFDDPRTGSVHNGQITHVRGFNVVWQGRLLASYVAT